MPLERIPKQPVARGEVPRGYTRYQVQDGDSWTRVAERHGIPARKLMFDNFATYDPKEINWYLREYVGCKKKTKDGFNWMFSSEASPGIIHVPLETAKTVPAKPEEEKPAWYSKLWAGIGKSHSGDLFVIGAHDMTGKIYNLGDEDARVRNAWVNINGFKFGPGLGGSIDAVLIIAHGYDKASEMNGVDGGWDFDLALMAKLSSVLKGVKGLGKTIETIEEYKKLRYATEQAIKNIGINKPGVYAIPIPGAGAGMHAWAGFKFGDIKVTSTGVGVP